MQFNKKPMEWDYKKVYWITPKNEIKSGAIAEFSLDFDGNEKYTIRNGSVITGKTFKTEEEARLYLEKTIKKSK